jgi:hypothetical protein
MPFYRFSSTSTTADDGYNVIAPYVGTGRWLLLRADTGVNSIAALQAVPVSERSPNLSLFVVGANQWFTFKSASPTLGTDVAPLSGTGAWELVTTPPVFIPPYLKTYESASQLALSGSIEVFFLVPVTAPISSQLVISGSIGVTLLNPVIAPISHQLAISGTISSPILAPISNQLAISGEAGVQIASAVSWLNLSTSDWLNLSTSDWLDLPPF